jgi:hypothetical protein
MNNKRKKKEYHARYERRINEEVEILKNKRK